MARLEVRISGFGGQGVIALGLVLGQAALFNQKKVTQTQSYGAEARGGVCSSEVVISDEEIYYPRVTKPDIIVVMSQEAFNLYSKDLKNGGTLIVDSDLVKLSDVDPTVKIYKVPVTKIAKAVLGDAIVANVVMLGALIAITNVVNPEAVKKSIVKRWPKYAELNIKAFHKGMELGNVALAAQKL